MSEDFSLFKFQQVCVEVAKSIFGLQCDEEPAQIRKDEMLTALRLLVKKRLRRGCFNPQSQTETLGVLQKTIDPKVFRMLGVRRICWEYWRTLRAEITNLTVELASVLSAFITSGLALPSLNSEDYPLHRAVFEGRLYCIRNLCLHECDTQIFCEIDLPDPLGHSALMLAVKLKKLEEVLVLVDHGANPKFRSSPDQATPIEQASGMKEKALSRVLLGACQRLQLSKWESQKLKVAAAMLQLPNFELKMKWECKSKFLPFVKRWTPSDSYHIFKRGEDLRCDMTLVGWNHFKAERGNVSLLFKGGSGQVFLVDRDSEAVRELLQSPNEKLIEVQLSQMLRYQRSTREIRSANVELIPVTDWKGDVTTKKIGAWLCQQYKVNCSIDMNLSKRAIVIDQQIAEMGSFDEYFQYCLGARIRSRAISTNTSLVTISPRSSRNVSKSVSARLWMNKEFPLKLEHFLPLLSFLGSVSKKAKTLKTVLSRLSSIGSSGFPVKARVPLMMTLKAHVQFEELYIGEIDPMLFSVPSYQPRNRSTSHPEAILTLNEFPEINEDDIFQETSLESSSRSTTRQEAAINLNCSITIEDEKEEQYAQERYQCLDLSGGEVVEASQTTGEENLDETSEMLPNIPNETHSLVVTARNGTTCDDFTPALTRQHVLNTLRLTSRTVRRTKDVDILLL